MINLKCEGVTLWGDGQTKRRWKQTLKRVSEFSPKGDVLDIAGPSEFGMRMAKKLNLEYRTTKQVDLNYDWYFDFQDEYKNVFCFEVLEHLINPLVFLNNLKSRLYDRSLVFITYPYQTRFFKGKNHWKEFTKEEFKTLAELSGFKVVHYDSFRNYLTPMIYLSGIRPLIKLVMSILGLIKIQFYVLKVKL